MSNRLMRNETGAGKYTVADNRTGQVVADDRPGEEHEFFVVMLKDKYALAALLAYAEAAYADGQRDYATDVLKLADRAGPLSKFCKEPD